MRKWFNIGLLLIIVAALLFAVIPQFMKEKKETVKEQSQTEKINRSAAADFTLPTLTGEKVRLSDSRGKLTILNFWASWCGPCKDEAPHLQTFYEENKDSIQLLAINVTAKDKLENAKQFVDNYNLTFPILLDETGDISTTYGAFTIPTTVFLNEDGEIVHEIAGPLTEQYLKEIVDSMQKM